MPCCCVKTLNLCNVPVCGTLEIQQEATAPESGVENIYTLMLDYLDTIIPVTGLQTEGQNIVFDISSLNENYQYIGQIFNSAGNKVDITLESGGDTYDCIKFRTTVSLNSTSTTVPAVLDVPNTVVIESIIGEDPVITGTAVSVSGLTDGSNTITSDAFLNVRVLIIRGNIPIPGIDPGDGSKYFTKILANDYITLNAPLADGEFIRIQTIPN